MTTESEGAIPHCLLFTGHRIDVPGRQTPRFPAASESLAKQLIQDAVHAEMAAYITDQFSAIASGANGGDILFLETCAEIGIPAEIYLAKPHDAFIDASVIDGGQLWVDRFEAMTQAFPVHILSHDPGSDLNVWQRTNLLMLDTTLATSGSNSSVIALWDGEEGDGPGGTKDMVMRAKKAGAHIVHIDATQLS